MLGEKWRGQEDVAPAGRGCESALNRLPIGMRPCVALVGLHAEADRIDHRNVASLFEAQIFRVAIEREIDVIATEPGSVVGLHFAAISSDEAERGDSISCDPARGSSVR